jgi:hypothetical protein
MGKEFSLNSSDVTTQTLVFFYLYEINMRVFREWTSKRRNTFRGYN